MSSMAQERDGGEVAYFRSSAPDMRWHCTTSHQSVLDAEWETTRSRERAWCAVACGWSTLIAARFPLVPISTRSDARTLVGRDSGFSSRVGCCELTTAVSVPGADAVMADAVCMGQNAIRQTNSRTLRERAAIGGNDIQYCKMPKRA